MKEMLHMSSRKHKLHMNQRNVRHGWGMLHKWVHMNESCHTFEWFTSHKRVQHVDNLNSTIVVLDMHRRAHTHTHTYTLSLSPSFSLSLTHTHARTHTHTHARTRTAAVRNKKFGRRSLHIRTYSLTHTHFYCNTLQHTYSLTHTHFFSLSNPRTHSQMQVEAKKLEGDSYTSIPHMNSMCEALLDGVDARYGIQVILVTWLTCMCVCVPWRMHIHAGINGMCEALVGGVEVRYGT